MTDRLLNWVTVNDSATVERTPGTLFPGIPTGNDHRAIWHFTNNNTDWLADFLTYWLTLSDLLWRHVSQTNCAQLNNNDRQRRQMMCDKLIIVLTCWHSTDTVSSSYIPVHTFIHIFNYRSALLSLVWAVSINQSITRLLRHQLSVVNVLWINQLNHRNIIFSPS